MSTDPLPATFLLAAVVAGLLAGSVHVLIGADHLAAVAPLAVDGRRRAWRAGWRWGLGHAGGVALVGLAALALRGALPVETLSARVEGAVGILLVAIGVWAGMAAVATLRGKRGTPGHLHDHTERAALAIGLVHGTAGAAHVVGILPALALPLAAGLLYLGAFAVGTVAAMTGFSAAIGTASARFGAGRRAYAGLMGACALASIAVGVWWMAA